MIINLNKSSNAVEVDGVVRTVDLSGLPAAILSVSYNSTNKTGFEVTANDERGFGLAVFNLLYARYLQAWKSLSPTQIRTIAEAKADKRYQINSLRDQLEASGFPYQSKTFDSDQRSVSRISISVQAAQVALANSAAFSIDWTAQDNSELTLDAAGMLGMPVALAVYADSLHKNARAKKLLIDSATTIEEVEAVTW